MNRGLADAELLRGGAHGRLVLYDVQGQTAGPLFDVSFHTHNTPCNRFSLTDVYAQGARDMKGRREIPGLPVQAAGPSRAKKNEPARIARRLAPVSRNQSMTMEFAQAAKASSYAPETLVKVRISV